ncbi:hypothetical protein MOKP38_36100 [Mycobacterium avium subsp. hominissuis]
MQVGQQLDDEAGLVGGERVQGVRELARLGRQILQHQQVAARPGVERGAVAVGDADHLRRQLAVEPHLGAAEPAELTHQAGGGGLGRDLDEHRVGDVLAGQHEPGPRGRPGVTAEHPHRPHRGAHHPGQHRRVDLVDRARQAEPAAQHRVDGHPARAATQVSRQAQE